MHSRALAWLVVSAKDSDLQSTSNSTRSTVVALPIKRYAPQQD